MGPLVPDVISNQMNLVLALLLGIAFGFVLEQAGFSSSRKLTGLFYGTDFTVLRVFFTAGVTAMSGVLLLSQFGLLDPGLIYINPTFLHSAILGGVIMGIGFVLGGYCPGTSFCGAAVGRVDGMAFVLGGAIGVFAFGEAFPLVQDFYTAGSMGDLLVFTPLGITAGQFAGTLIAVAVVAFVLTTRIEKKVSPESPAWSFPVIRHRFAGAALLAFAVVLFATPDRRAWLTAKIADPVYRGQHPVRLIAPDELAFYIMDRDPRFQLIDVRESGDYAKTTLPGAINLTAASLLGKEAEGALDQPRILKVFFARTEEDSVRAAALAQLAGFENVAALQGGLEGFTNVILKSSAENGATFQDVATFRARAREQITAMIRERSAPKVIKTLKRVQGGCGG